VAAQLAASQEGLSSVGFGNVGTSFWGVTSCVLQKAAPSSSLLKIQQAMGKKQAASLLENQITRRHITEESIAYIRKFT
jgi:hypothetical protein